MRGRGPSRLRSIAHAKPQKYCVSVKADAAKLNGTKSITERERDFFFLSAFGFLIRMNNSIAIGVFLDLLVWFYTTFRQRAISPIRSSPLSFVGSFASFDQAARHPSWDFLFWILSLSLSLSLVLSLALSHSLPGFRT